MTITYCVRTFVERNIRAILYTCLIYLVFPSGLLIIRLPLEIKSATFSDKSFCSDSASDMRIIIELCIQQMWQSYRMLRFLFNTPSKIYLRKDHPFHFLTSSVSPIHCRHGRWRRTLTSCRRFYASCSIAALCTASSRPASSQATSRHCWRKRTSTRPTLSLIDPSLTCPSYPSCSNDLSYRLLCSRSWVTFF